LEYIICCPSEWFCQEFIPDGNASETGVMDKKIFSMLEYHWFVVPFFKNSHVRLMCESAPGIIHFWVTKLSPAELMIEDGQA
jgi:hypothetical protein